MHGTPSPTLLGEAELFQALSNLQKVELLSSNSNCTNNAQPGAGWGEAYFPSDEIPEQTVHRQHKQQLSSATSLKLRLIKKLSLATPALGQSRQKATAAKPYGKETQLRELF